eukprot:672950-Rhodomonas_salina.1
MVLGTGAVAPWVQPDDISIDVALEYTCTNGDSARRLLQAGWGTLGGDDAPPTMARWRLKMRIAMKG